MNQDTDTTKYVAKLKDLTLSESARTRIQANLSAYAAFHSVRSDAVGRSIGVVTKPTFLFPLRFSYMPFVILFAVMIGGGTSLAAQGAVPGDFLYPIKIGVNENVRSAFAVGADSEAKLQTNLLAERVEEAETLQAEGRLSGDMAETVASTISAQAKIATAASVNSSAVVATETTAKIQSALQTVLAIADLNVDAGVAGSGPMMATTLAKKQYEIGTFKAVVQVRIKSLADLVKKYQSDIDAKVYADLIAKLDTAAKLSAAAETEAEADARVTLEQASTLAGEVEAKLSTLGQVEVSDNGLITDIDFSIDPMILDRGEGNTNDGVPTDPRAAQSGSSLEGSVKIDGSLDSSVIDAGVEGATSVKSGAELSL